MRVFSKYLLALVAGIFFSITVPARDIPSLPVDAGITKGTLRCGYTYYMIKGSGDKGFADVTVITDAAAPEADCGFFIRNGIGPRRGGFSRLSGPARVYNFDRIPMYNQAVVDSTLLEAFKIAAYSPYHEAVIIAGDFDSGEIKKRMDVFSMMVPYRSPYTPENYDGPWAPFSAPEISVTRTGSAAWASVSYSAPRVPHDYMDSAQSLVSEILGDQFLTVLKHRLEKNFRKAGVSPGSVEFSHRTGDVSPEDEMYTVRAVTSPDEAGKAVEVIAGTLGRMSAGTIGEEELRDAKTVMAPEAKAATRRVKDYSTLAENNYIYGANLAPVSEYYRLLTRKNVSDSLSAALMNSFASGLLGEGLSHLKLDLAQGDSLEWNDVLFRYNMDYSVGRYGEEDNTDYTWRRGDTLALSGEASRMKIKSTAVDPVSGGQIWTFSNGIRVIFKPMTGSRSFYYGVLFSRGLTSVHGLREGEGGYIADMFRLYDAAGLPAPNFRDLLSVHGITMDARVNMNNTLIGGTAPSAKLPLLMRMLLSLANHRQLDAEEFELFRKGQQVLGESEEDILHGRLYPGYNYSLGRKPSVLDQSTQVKAETFFEQQFSGMNYATLVFVGDLDEAHLRRVLSRSLGEFRVAKSQSPRKSVRNSPLSGTITRVVGDGQNRMEVLVSGELPLSAVNNFAVPMAMELLRRRIVRAMPGTDFSVDVSAGFVTYPEERLEVRISVEGEGDITAAAAALRNVLASAPSDKVSSEDVAALRSMMLSRMERSMSTPGGMFGFILRRYGDGKDLLSRYKENIASIGSDRIKTVLSAVSSGGRVEYIYQ